MGYYYIGVVYLVVPEHTNIGIIVKRSKRVDKIFYREFSLADKDVCSVLFIA